MIYYIIRTLHEESFTVLETVRKCGALGRESRELEEAVRAEMAEGRAGKAKQLANDLQALQAENKTMAKKYSRLVK